MKYSKILIIILAFLCLNACKFIRGYTINDLGYLVPTRERFKLKGQFDASQCDYNFPLAYVFEQDTARWARYGLEVQNHLGVMLFFNDGRSFFGRLGDTTLNNCENLHFFLDNVSKQYFVCVTENQLKVEYYAVNASIRGYYIENGYYLNNQYMYASPTRFHSNDSIRTRLIELLKNGCEF